MPRPTWAYPASKVRTEQLIRDERGTIPAVLLRISGVYDDGGHSIPLVHQIQRINERDLTSRFYSGSTAHGQSFMHMDDLVDAIERVVDRRAALPPEIAILLGEPEPVSYDELQHTIARLIRGANKETIALPGALAPMAKVGAWMLDHVPGQEGFVKPWMIDRANDHYALDITRARTLLGWEPKRTLRETLPKMVAGMKADPLGWYRENELKPSKIEKTVGRAATPIAVALQEAPTKSRKMHVHESRDDHGASAKPTHDHDHDHDHDHAPGHSNHPSPSGGMEGLEAGSDAPMAMAHGQRPTWPHFAEHDLGRLAHHQRLRAR